jgi:hypothetical protein
MGLLQFEKQIVQILQFTENNTKIKLKHLMEWRTSEIKDNEVQQGEKKVYLKSIGVWAVYKL